MSHLIPASPDMSLLSIRPAKQDDYGAIAAIYNEAIGRGGITMDAEPFMATDVKDLVEKMNPREALFVGEVEGRVIGWGIIKRYSDRVGYQVCCETSVYLSFQETGKGYGKQLQRHLIQKVSEYGYFHIVAKILADNRGSIHFHLRLGFEIVGTQKAIGCVKGTWHDVVILQYLFPKPIQESS